MRGADLLARSLATAGVETVYSLSGNQIMPVYDALLDVDIEIVHVRYEAAAVFMADAYAQLTGRVGVALVTAGPGAANAVGPLYAVKAAESPVVLLTGDSPLPQDGMGAFQELDQSAMSAPLTKLSFRAATAAGLGTDIARAFRVAVSGRPGPVHLALPADLAIADVGDVPLPPPAAFAAVELAPAAARMQTIAGALQAAEKPIVLAGPTLARTRAGALLDTLATALDAPVVPMESPRGLNDPALGALGAVLGEADLILSLGKSIDFMVGFGAATTARWIVVDADAAEFDRAHRNLGARLDQTALGDAAAAAAMLNALGAGGARRQAWRDRVKALLARRAEPGASDDDDEITALDVAAAVQKRIDAAVDAVLIIDGGEFGQWSQAGVTAGRRVINGPGGAIGAAPCYGLAAKKALPDATVFALMGDGTAGFHMMEFETAVRAEAPFVAVIGNDRRWNAEHQIQLRDYGPNRLIGCELSDARYDLVVAGLGGHGEFVECLADLEPALDRALAAGRPACVNVRIKPLQAPIVRA